MVSIDNNQVHSSPNSFSNELPGENKKVELRVKKAVNRACIVLATTFTTTAVASAITGTIFIFTVSHVIIPALCGIVLVVSVVGLSILGFLKAWEKITPHLPPILKVPCNYIQSSVCGLASIAILTVTWPTNLTKKNVLPKDVDPNQPLIIAIHGFMGSSNNFRWYRDIFEEEGYNNFASVNLGNWLDPIDIYIEKVRALVLHYKNNAPLPPDGKLKIQFLCHSMGGLVANLYNQKYANSDGVEIEDIITLGTPLDGTRVAYLAFGLSGAARQMHPKSQFVRGLQDSVMNDETTHHFNVGSKCDFVVPCKSAITSKAKNRETVVLEATGHVSLLFSPRAVDECLNYMKRRKASKTLPV